MRSGQFHQVVWWIGPGACSRQEDISVHLATLSALLWRLHVNCKGSGIASYEAHISSIYIFCTTTINRKKNSNKPQKWQSLKISSFAVHAIIYTFLLPCSFIELHCSSSLGWSWVNEHSRWDQNGRYCAHLLGIQTRTSHIHVPNKGAFTAEHMGNGMFWVVNKRWKLAQHNRESIRSN